MKKLTFLFLLSTLLVQFASCKNESKSEDKTSEQKVPFGDPFIMLHDGKYYAYGTHGSDGIEVYTSDNLNVWEGPLGVNSGYALHKNDVLGEKWFWAPEVYFINGKFYMYFSAEEHICVATADSPFGPFKQEVQQPMIADEKCIDNSLFTDDDAKPYLLFDRFNDGLNIWIAGLEDDLMTLKMETMTKCIHVSQPWEEVWPRVNEGSFIIKHNDIYYMTYSANSYESKFYGIGFATADNVFGPWTKYDKNPIFQKPKDLVGVGHSAMFTDKDAQLRIVFHSHKSKTEIHPRHMYISKVGFEMKDGKEIMTIDEDFLTPVLK